MIKNKKICVYTCITGDYDNVCELPFIEEGIDYYLFTNNKKINSTTWKIVYIEDKKLDNVRLARKIKILGFPGVLDNYDISIWIDGNVTIKRKIEDFLNEQCNLNDYAMVGFKHSVRNCIYEEATMCVRYHKANKEVIEKQIKALEKEGYPKNNGLIESTILVRKVHDEKVKDTMKVWFEWIENYSSRDQLSFNYAAYKTNLKIQYLNLNALNNEYFYAEIHKVKNKISHYRIYFGDESQDYDFKYDIQNDYTKSKAGLYTIREKVPRDTGVIIFEPEIFISGLHYSEISISGINLEKIYLEDGIEIGKTKIFLRNRPRIFIYGNFTKNKNIQINADFKIAQNEEYVKLIEQLVNENTSLNNKVSELIEEEKNLVTKYQKKEKEVIFYKNELDKVLKSKGWILLEKARKLKGGKHYEK